ncbi:hypothetical protein [Mesorhizobium sp. M1403]|uniref:hypothetical protein n=1 Tax=Mesorhizobium sp. M1403 TaxID=2957097 RepID=UPI0033399B16
MSSLDQGAPLGAMAAQGTTSAKRGATLALLAFAQLIIALDLNIVFVALPGRSAPASDFQARPCNGWSAPIPCSPAASYCSAAGPPT